MQLSNSRRVRKAMKKSLVWTYTDSRGETHLIYQPRIHSPHWSNYFLLCADIQKRMNAVGGTSNDTILPLLSIILLNIIKEESKRSKRKYVSEHIDNLLSCVTGLKARR